jgi:hypothetical protein
MANSICIKRQRLVLENGVSVLAERIILNPHISNSLILEHIRYVKKGTSQEIETKSVIRYTITPYEKSNKDKSFGLNKNDLLKYYNHPFVHTRYEKDLVVSE